MLLTKQVKIKWNTNNKKWFIEKDYKFTKYHDEFIVNVNDLMLNSNVHVEIKCDYCGEIFTRKYSKYINNRKILAKDACINCKSKKIQESNMIKYGVKNVFQLNEIKEKSKETLLNIYGFDHYSKTNEYKLKYKNTCLDRYGVENVFQSDIVKQKSKNTLKLKYNCTNISQNKNIVKLRILKIRYPYNYIKDFIHNNQCTLLTTEDEYVNTKTDLNITCSCGNIFVTTFSYFRHENKRQCDDCGLDMRSGENAPTWKGGISSLRDIIKNTIEYKNWRQQVFGRDNYACQCCGDKSGGNLVAHHIENFSSNEDLRFDINNGITLCNSCHNPVIKNSFHYIYGTTNNSKEQLKEFIVNSREIH